MAIMVATLAKGFYQLCWYLLPFALAGMVAWVIYRFALHRACYWLAYIAFAIPVLCIASSLADNYITWLHVFWVYHAPAIIPGLMIAPVLLVGFFMQGLGYGNQG